MITPWRLFLLSASTALAAQVSLPDRITQGEVLRVQVTGAAPVALRAKLGDKTVPFFSEADNRSLYALVPVPVRFPPGKHEVIVLQADGAELARRDVTVLDGRFPKQNIVVSPQMKSLQPLPGEMEMIRDLYATVSPHRHWREPFLVPVPDCRNSPFGVLRLHNGQYTGNFHRGVDQRSPPGRPVQATAAGVVKIARMFGLHGGTVGLDHGHGVTSIYIHLSAIDAKEGDLVPAGAVIGRVGATGFATGPHLHWGIYVHGEPVNPLQWTGDISACAASSAPSSASVKPAAKPAASGKPSASGRRRSSPPNQAK